MDTKQLLQNLLKLQALELDDIRDDDPDHQIAHRRARIPAPILAHYDRLTVRGKKGVAMVRHDVCTACHMRVPRATVVYLMRGEDIQVCECCGAYLYLPELADNQAPRPVEKPAAKSRKRRELAHAA